MFAIYNLIFHVEHIKIDHNKHYTHPTNVTFFVCAIFMIIIINYLKHVF